MQPVDKNPPPPSEPPPLFIVGCPRSGTTLLAELLDATPWARAEESHFIPKYHQRLTRYQPLGDLKNRLRLIRAIFSERPVQSWFLDADLHSLAERTDGDFSSIVDQICLLRARTLGKKAWADKTPEYVLELETIHRLFPKAKFIHLIRDGRDVAVSLLDKAWGPSNVFNCASYWVECSRQRPLQDHLRNEGLYYRLKYEDLLRAPTQTLAAIFDFLEQPHDASSLAGRCRTIRQTNTGAWTTKLSRRQVEVFERVAASTLNAHGYPTTHAQGPIPPLTRFGYRCHELLCKLWVLFHLNVIEGIKIKLLGKDPFGD